jgi:mannose-6-phosphate isomerase-like protein (cupin superfamily)
VLAAGATDEQQPHDRDELYYVVSGRGVLVAGGERLAAEPGSLLYVRAEVPHRFVEIEEELEVLIFLGARERRIRIAASRGSGGS